MLRNQAVNEYIYNNTLYPKECRETFITIDNSSGYFPSYCSCIREKLFSNRDDIWLYPKANHIENSGTSNYSDYTMFEALKYYSKMVRFEFYLPEDRGYNNAHYICVNKGFITDNDGKILLCLCVKGDRIFNINYNFDGELNPDECELFISDEFLFNPIYEKIRTDLRNDYMHEIMGDNIPILIEKSEKIESILFQKVEQDEELITFDTIDELEDKLKNISRYLNYDLSYFNQQFLNDELGLRLNIIDDVREIVLLDDTLIEASQPHINHRVDPVLDDFPF